MVSRRTRRRFVREIRPHVELFRDPVTGLAWVEDGTTGAGHSCHANIDVTGSVTGMKNRGYWSKADRVVRSHGFAYNIDTFIVSDELDAIAAQHCQCGGRHSHERGVVV